MTQTRPWFRKEPGGASERWQSVFSFFCKGRVSRLRARPKGFPIALWKPSGPYLVERLGNGNLWFYWTPVGIRALGYFPGLWEQIAAPGAYRRGPWFIAGLLFFVLQTLHLVELAHRVL